MTAAVFICPSATLRQLWKEAGLGHRWCRSVVGGVCAAFKQPSIQSRACTHEAGTIYCKTVHGCGCRHGIAWSGAALLVAIWGARHAADAAVASARTHP